MAMRISKADLWVVGVPDVPGTLAAKLSALSDAGANFQWVLARRSSEAPGESVVFLTPLKGAKQIKAAESAGFRKLDNIFSVRIESPDKPGLAANVTRKLGEAGVNLRGFSAASLGRTCVIYLALESAAAAEMAMKVLKKIK